MFGLSKQLWPIQDSMWTYMQFYFCLTPSGWWPTLCLKVIAEDDHNKSLSMEFVDIENDLNHIFLNFVDSEDETNNFSLSNYVAIADIQSIFQTGQSDFLVATLYIENIKAKFDNLYAIMNNLSAHGQYLALFLVRKLGRQLMKRWCDIISYTRS